MAIAPIQLYPRSRTDNYSVQELGVVFSLSYHDTQCDGMIYNGMDRARTIATAWRSCADIANAIIHRAFTDDTADALRLQLADLIGEIPKQ